MYVGAMRRMNLPSLRSHLLLISLTVFCCVSRSFADEIHIFILTGQSNARPQMALGFEAGLRSSNIWDNVVVFNSQRSNQWLSRWVTGPEGELFAGDHFVADLWAEDGSSQLQQLIASYEAQGHAVTVGGFVWFQGEGDSCNDGARARYEERLTWLFQELQSKYGNFPKVITLIDWNHNLPDELLASERIPEDIEEVRTAQINTAITVGAYTAESRGRDRYDLWHIGDADDQRGLYAKATDFGADVSGILIQNSSCTADINHDGILNFFDVSLFLQAYNAGCP